MLAVSEQRRAELVVTYSHGPKLHSYAAHMWPQIWGHYDMMNSSKENVQETIRWTKEYIMGELLE